MNDVFSKKSFLNYCTKNNFQQNINQIKLIESLISFYNKNFQRNLISKLFLKKFEKLCFYLVGDVGVGKTMILNFFFNNINQSKKRIHFNEFMINFHDFHHNFKKKGKENPISFFVRELKMNYSLIYLDEFQVTNIVDAMILGTLFENIFKENIKLIITSNIKIKDLYKDGLQRDQFLKFISIIKKHSIEYELSISKDYRKLSSSTLERFFYPMNQETNFKINQIFRKFTKEKKLSIKTLVIKGRDFKIKNYYEGVARFQFDNLCGDKLGSEDYVKISNECNFIIIENIPQFNEENKDRQQRFITFIDILYEKKIPLTLSSCVSLNELGSSYFLKKSFKRTLSRIFELTSPTFL